MNFFHYKILLSEQILNSATKFKINFAVAYNCRLNPEFFHVLAKQLTYLFLLPSPLNSILDQLLKFQAHSTAVRGILKQAWMTIADPDNYYASLLRKADFEVLRCESKVTTDFLTEKELHGLSFVTFWFAFAKRKQILILDGLVLGLFGKSIAGLNTEERSEFSNYIAAMLKSKLPTAGNGKFWELSGRRMFVTAKKLGRNEERFLFNIT